MCMCQFPAYNSSRAQNNVIMIETTKWATKLLIMFVLIPVIYF